MKGPDAATVEERRRRGIDKFDEVWEGVYHVVPSPDWDHQQVVMRLGVFLDDHVLRHGLGHANHDVNVRRPGSGARNFRVPDVVFVSTERQSIIGGKWVEGGPDVVFELRSKGDETYEKLPFYAEVGVDVLVVLKGRTTWLEPYRLVNGAWQPMAPDADGRFLLDRAAVTLRQVSREGRYALEGASTRGDGALVVV